MKPLAATLVLLSALSAQSPDRAQAIAKLEKCLRAPSADTCGGRPIEKVLALYSAGDRSLLPLIFRAHRISLSSTEYGNGKFYLEIFDRDANEFLSAAADIPEKDRAEVFDAFSDTVAESSEARFQQIRLSLAPTDAAQKYADTRKRLLYDVELKNASRLHQYFPVGTFGNARDDQFHQQWYSRNLFALRESPIYSEPLGLGNAIYRFLWLRSFDNPVSVRLRVLPDGRGVLTLRVSDGMAGYNQGVLVNDKEMPINAADVNTLERLLEKGSFWKEPTVPPPPSGTVSVDGAQWVIEANKEGQYHVIDRWSPDKGAFREAALFLLKKSGYVVPKNEIY